MNQTENLPSQVGVLGGGQMGAGIAHAFLTQGCTVTVVERDDTSAQTARERVLAAVAESVRRGAKPGGGEDQRLHVSTSYEDFASCDLVVEAVFEDWDVKARAVRDVERHTSRDAVIATNTSSMSVTGLAREMEQPHRFIGLHFFNPVPASKLVEVVLAEQTDHATRTAAERWVEALGKTAVVVHDAPGFASSRLGVAIALEAIRMVEEGVASPQAIDDAMVLGYRFPIGPLALTDLVGLDVRLGIAEYLAEHLGDRFAPPQLMRDMVARGELGRKSGRGFYAYDAPTP